MGGKELRVKIIESLVVRDFDTLLNWAASARNPQRILLSLSYDSDELIRWRAIEALGKVAGLLAMKDIERMRDLIRRLLWLMNDESGGLGWSSPEIIGEILVNVPDLIEEFAGLLPAYLKEEPFERGSHLAVYRVASIDAKQFTGKVSILEESLTSHDPVIRIYAFMTLDKIEPGFSRSRGDKYQEDESKIRIYDFDSGHLHNTTVKHIVRKILATGDFSQHAA